MLFYCNSSIKGQIQQNSSQTQRLNYKVQNISLHELHLKGQGLFCVFSTLNSLNVVRQQTQSEDPVSALTTSLPRARD